MRQDRSKRTAAAPATIASAAIQTANRRAETLIALSYADIFGCTEEEAHKKLRQADQTLYHSWRNLKTLNEVGWSPTDDGQPRSSYDLIYGANSLTSYLQANPAVDQATARSMAQHYLTQSPTIVMDESALSNFYQSVLQRGLHWIDPQKVGANRLSATQILQTVCRHRRPELASRAALVERLQHRRDVIVDEAALIAFNAQSGAGLIARDASMQLIRAHYASALIDEWQDAALGLHLLPSSPIPPEHAEFWFDGAVLQNARGKNMAQIAAALYTSQPAAEEEPVMQRLLDSAGKIRHLIGQPNGPITAAKREALTHAMHGIVPIAERYAQRAGTDEVAGVWLTRPELQAIVEKTMHNLMLDVHYPIGTPLHAIASIMQRLGPMHGIDFGHADDPALLMRAFNRLSKAWHNDPHFAVAPSLCAARYLAQTSNVRFFNTQSPLSSAQQIAQQVTKDFLPVIRNTGNIGDADDTAKTEHWKRSINRFSNLNPLRRLGDSVSVKNPRVSAIHEGLQARVNLLRHAPETIRYANTLDLSRQLDSYLAQRLLSQSPLPVFDKDAQVKRILRRKLGMTDADLSARNPIPIVGSPFLGRPLPHPLLTVTAQEEFKTRVNLFDSDMAFKGRTIDAAHEWKIAKEEAAALVAVNPVIAAKAKEVLRQKANVNNQETIDRMRWTMARGIVGLPQTTTTLEDLLGLFDTLFGSPTISTIVTSLASGDARQMLQLLPFVIPLYDIEEGIRLNDRKRVLEGAVHLGEDAIFTVIGAGMENVMRRQLAHGTEAMLLARVRMSPAERAGVDMMGDMMELFPEVSPTRLEQRRVTIAEDTFSVLATADALDTAETAPKRLQRGEPQRQRPDRRAHHTLFLLDEKRTVAVEPIEDGFLETDLRGNIIADAPMIFGDLRSGRGYRLNRDVDLLGGVAAIEKPALLARGTTKDVLRYWKPVAALPNIRLRRPDPHMIVRALFEPSDHPWFGPFEKFWQKVYALSDTAVTIMNAAHDRLIFRGNCEITFDAAEATACGGAVCLLSDKALAQKQYVSIGGTVRFQRARMWLHESLHWMGQIGDIAAEHAHNHRGATIYLTDRILSELGAYPLLPARLAYKMPPVLDPAAWPHRSWASNLRVLHDWTIAEDKLLDATLDAGRDFSSSLMIAGQNVAERVTVRQGLAFIDYMKSHKKPLIGNVQHLLQLVRDSFATSLRIDHPELLKRLITDSKSFRAIAHAWSDKAQYARITIDRVYFDNDELAPALTHRAHVSAGKKIWLNRQKLYYHSASGLSALTRIRQYTGALIDFFLSEIIPAERNFILPNRFIDRGLSVLLENEVLRQLGDPSPPRICARLTLDPEAYIRHQSTVNRAGVSENGYLRQQARGGPIEKSIHADDDLLGLSDETAPEHA